MFASDAQPSEPTPEDQIAAPKTQTLNYSADETLLADEEGRKRKTPENEEVVEASKKIKATEVEDHNGSIEGGKFEDALDATYLEDDSFVDEVKNDH